MSGNVPGAPNPPAGWYPDPHAIASQRYWDGSQWLNIPSPNQPSITENIAAQVSQSSISVYAVISLVSAFFVPILPVIFGHMAKSEIRKSNGAKTGEGLATAGLILGYLGIAAILFVMIGLVAFSTSAGY